MIHSKFDGVDEFLNADGILTMIIKEHLNIESIITVGVIVSGGAKYRKHLIHGGLHFRLSLMQDGVLFDKLDDGISKRIEPNVFRAVSEVGVLRRYNMRVAPEAF